MKFILKEKYIYKYAVARWEHIFLHLLQLYLFKHHLETKALKRLKNDFQIAPTLYARFIDDIILGPFESDNNTFKQILDVFNSINKNIQFTGEIPEPNNPLNFLDISIKIEGNKIHYEWYRKACHSEILLKEESHIPTHMKNNFITNTIKKIEKNCSTEESTKTKIKEFKNLLKSNGYSDTTLEEIRKKTERISNSKKYKKQGANKTPLIMNFINDKTSRKINQLIHKYDLDVQLISKPGPNLQQILNKQQASKQLHQNCDICKRLQKKYNCEQRFVVYEFRCKLCNKCYIGQTARPFYFRYREHQYSINKSNDNSALSQHLITEHASTDKTINNFYLSFLELYRTPVDCKLGEAMWIRTRQPTLNRKEELVNW